MSKFRGQYFKNGKLKYKVINPVINWKDSNITAQEICSDKELQKELLTCNPKIFR